MGQDAPTNTTRVAELEARLRAEEKKLALVQDIGRALSSALDLDQLLALVMEKITILMDADRSTLFLVSDDGRDLWSKVLQGGEVLEIRLRVGEGIAGWVSQTGEIVNIPDAYIDKRFQPAVDLRSGYRTRSILCMPMRNSLGNIIGVVQVLNKTDGPFTEADEQLLSALIAQAAVSVENSKLYHSVVAKNTELLAAQERLKQRTFELNVLFEIEKQLSVAMDLDELLDRLLRHAMEVIGAESGSVALCSSDGSELSFRTAAGAVAESVKRRSLYMGEGVIGWVAQQRVPVIVNDPENDERHHLEFAESVGLRPRNILCAPLISGDEVVGAIQLLNKSTRGGSRDFTHRGLKMLVLIAGQASKAIQIARGKAEREREGRLSAIGQMLAGVLHDLKTPMTIISGYAQLMAQIDEADQREKYVEQILRQFDLMSGMTREVLAFARGETNILVRKVYMHRFLDEVRQRLEHDLGSFKVAVDVDAQYRGTAYFDQQKMLRLIHNLARNAAQAMTGPGTFTVRTRAEGESIYFDFVDDGPGIPASMEGRLFELFSSDREGGTGLGLAIVKKIVDEHGGEISYSSKPGEGTTFTVRLAIGKPSDASDATGEIRIPS